MALSQDMAFRGINIPEAYIRIERFVFTSKTDCRGYVQVYSRAGEMEAIPHLGPGVIDFQYDFNDPTSLHGQAYKALKAKADFASAKDV